MDGDVGVLDVEQQGGAGEGDAGGGQDGGLENREQGTGTREQLTPEQRQARADREYKNWLKTLRDSDPKTHGRFARTAQDDRGRLIELTRLEPKGIDGVREKYAILDSVSYDDPERGVLTGPEAVAALQDQVRDMAEVDEWLATGDKRALDALGDDFNEGLAKLTPAILERVAASDEQAYIDALRPHLMNSVAQSPLFHGFNAMVDVLNEEMPRWLPDDKKQAWVADKFARLAALVKPVADWWAAESRNAGGDGKGANVPRGTQAGNREQGTGKPDKQAQERERLETQAQEQHWKNNIAPKLNQLAKDQFREIFRPYAKRLRLDVKSLDALKDDFIDRVTKKAATDKAYSAQIARFARMRNPSPEIVVNFVRAKVSQPDMARVVFQELINERYKPFLSGPRAQGQGAREQGSGNGNGVKRTPVSPGVTVVGVKPAAADIDFKNTPIGWIHERKYRLTNGKVVQVRG